QARGLRAPGSDRGGSFRVTASKTVGAPIGRLYKAFVDPAVRERWLPDVALRERRLRQDNSARFDFGDGSTRIAVGFVAKGEARSTVSLLHEKLSDDDTAAEMGAFWRERLDELKSVLEGSR